jgi:Tol biopolymer transport system component
MPTASVNQPSRLRMMRSAVAFAAIVAFLSSGVRADDQTPLKDLLKVTPYKIAFEAYHDGNSDIWVMNADGSNAVNLTHSPDQQEHYPQVSPDGSKICYTVDRGEGRDAVRSLWVMNIDGTNQTKIAENAREPFWSPDGKVIGYLPQEYAKFNVIDYYTKGMVYYNVDTGKAEPHPNTDKLRHLYHPRFSPNGKWIVATVHGGMGYGHAILLIEAHGDKIINLHIPGCRPSISPDGKHIAWGSEDHEIDTAPLDTDSDTPSVGSRQLRIQDKKNKVYHIAWSPDGQFVAFSRGPDGEGDLAKTGTFQAACEIIGVYATDWNLFAAPANHKGIRDLDHATDADLLQLTTSGCSNKEPMWFAPAPRTKE